MAKTLQKLMNVSRPVSWINTAFPFVATYVALGGQNIWLGIVGGLFFLIPYNLLMYGVNDVYDYESDIRNPRKGTIEGAVEAKAFHPTILRACVALTLPVGLWFGLLIPPPALPVFAGVLFFVVAYSLKGLRFKEIPILDSVTSSLHFVGPMIVALAILNYPAEAWPFVVAFFMWGMASHAFGAVQDVIPDRDGGLASIATVLGARATVWFSTILYLAACGIVAAQGGLAIIIAASGLGYIALTAPYIRITDATSGQSNRGWRRFIYVNYFVGFIVTICLILGAF